MPDGCTQDRTELRGPMGRSVPVPDLAAAERCARTPSGVVGRKTAGGEERETQHARAATLRAAAPAANTRPACTSAPGPLSTPKFDEAGSVRGLRESGLRAAAAAPRWELVLRRVGGPSAGAATPFSLSFGAGGGEAFRTVVRICSCIAGYHGRVNGRGKSLRFALGCVLVLGGLAHSAGVLHLYVAKGLPDANRILLDAWIAEAQLCGGALFVASTRTTAPSAFTLAGAAFVWSYAVPFLPVLLGRAPAIFWIAPITYLVLSAIAVVRSLWRRRVLKNHSAF